MTKKTENTQHNYKLALLAMVVAAIMVSMSMGSVYAVTTVTLDPGIGCGSKNWGLKHVVSGNATFGFNTDCSTHSGPNAIGPGASARWNYLDVRATNVGTGTGLTPAWEAGLQGKDPFGNSDTGGGATNHNTAFPLAANKAYTLTVQYLWFKNSLSKPNGASDNVNANLLTNLWFKNSTNSDVLVVDFLWDQMNNDGSGNWKQASGLTVGSTYYTPYYETNPNNATQRIYHYSVVLDTGGSSSYTWYAPSTKNIQSYITSAFQYTYHLAGGGGTAHSLTESNFQLVNQEQGAEISPQTSTSTGTIKAAFSGSKLEYS